MCDANAIEINEDIIYQANNKVGDGENLDIKGTGYLHANEFVLTTHKNNEMKLAHDYLRRDQN